MKNIGVVLLAAGQSRRFGSQKLMYPLKMDSQRDPQPMLGWTIESIRQVTDQLIVVADAAQNDLIDFLIASDVSYVLNTKASQGIGLSLATGIKDISDAWDGAMIALGDMPFIQPESYQALLARSLPNAIVIPEVELASGEAKRGNPVVFGREFFDELVVLDEDKGGRDVIQHHQSSVITVRLDDSGLLQDIDQPDDLLNLSA
ncbi:NTP transferase domain-containing protein [Litoribrevibacter euphylliae]|uniref:NTP transferase domain-containing protein n=1 Tax=Litoribrevibacter euphylliae TaxID=1834034 RepID=A0ABV7HDI7_9GAMM